MIDHNINGGEGESHYQWALGIILDVTRGIVQQATVCSIFLFTVEIVLPWWYRQSAGGTSSRRETEITTMKQPQTPQQQQRQRKIQPTANRFEKVWSHEIPHAISTLGISGYTIKGLIQQLQTNGSINIIDTTNYDKNNILTVLIRWLFEVVTYFVVFDAYFYGMHRYFHHNKFLYRWIHQSHHVSTSPNAIVGMSFNPIEGALFGSFLPMYSWVYSHLVGGILKPTLVTCGFLQLFQSLLIHSGYEFVSPNHFEQYSWRSKFLTPTFHDRHHEKFNCNYSGFFTYLDDYFGTSDPNWNDNYSSWQRDGRISSQRGRRKGD